jgi:O-6-methylguanine DNA methyltransferase
MNIEAALAGMRVPAPPTIEEGALLGVGLIDGYAEYDSPLGAVVVAFNPSGVSSVDLAADDAEDQFLARFGRRMVPARPPKGWDVKIGRAIERGAPGDLPVDLRLVSAFQRQVLELTATIPRGEVRPYGWLAREVGRPSAVRAVGSTMARNPVPLIVPCHRVVRTDGLIGNYSLGGPDRKWQLLRHEGTDPEALERLAARKIRFVGNAGTLVFCHPTCHRAPGVGDPLAVPIHSREDAGSGGFAPCPACRP